MKTKLAITALALAFSTPAIAYNPQGNVELCETIREGSQNAMEFRQRGFSLDVALSTENPFFDVITAEAYTYPLFNDIPIKAEVIMAFGSQMYLSCMSGDIEFDANNVMQFIK